MTGAGSDGDLSERVKALREAVRIRHQHMPTEMANKLSCPGCYAYTSEVLQAVRDGEPCPYCGIPASAIEVANPEWELTDLRDHIASIRRARLTRSSELAETHDTDPHIGKAGDVSGDELVDRLAVGIIRSGNSQVINSRDTDEDLLRTYPAAREYAKPLLDVIRDVIRQELSAANTIAWKTSGETW